MYLEVDGGQAPPTVAMREAADLKELKLVALNGATATQVSEALEGVGSLRPDGDVQVSVDGLLRLAGSHADNPSWRRSFDKMMEYAESHGWVLLGGAEVRVHCQWGE